MIVTDRFVLLNYPRTGSTFVREVLRRLHGQENRGLLHSLRGRLAGESSGFSELTHLIDRTEMATKTRRRSQHGAFSQIPGRHREKPVVSVTRHPFDRLVSMYEHRFWRDHPPAAPGAIRALFPEFPALTFAQYLDLLDVFDVPNVLKGQPLRADVGPQTLHFVRFYARDPDGAIARLTDDAVDRGALADELGDVRFLHQESLARELVDFLRDVGFEDSETAFVLDAEPVNVTAARRGRSWNQYLDPERARRLAHRERFLFRHFPEYGS